MTYDVLILFLWFIILTKKHSTNVKVKYAQLSVRDFDVNVSDIRTNSFEFTAPIFNSNQPVLVEN